MESESVTVTPDKESRENTQSVQNTRIVKVGNTTVEITHHFNGSCTYEDVVKNAIKREAENR